MRIPVPSQTCSRRDSNYCGDRIDTDRKNHDCCLLSSSRKGPMYVFEILMAPTDRAPACRWVTTHTSYWFSSRRSSRVSLSRASLPLTRLGARASERASEQAQSLLLASLLSGCSAAKLEPALTLSAHARARPSDDWSPVTSRERQRERERGNYQRAYPFPTLQIRGLKPTRVTLLGL